MLLRSRGDGAETPGVTHSVGVSLDGQSRVHGQDFKQERQPALEPVLDLGAQAGGEAGDPLSQRGLSHSVVFNLSVTFGVSPHPQLEEAQPLVPA